MLLYPLSYSLVYLTFLQSHNLFTVSYVDYFTVSCSNSYVAQRTEALTARASNIEEWADERGLAIFVLKSTFTLDPSNTHL